MRRNLCEAAAEENVIAEHILDVRGYRCPVPVIKLEAALRRSQPGEKITILADDPVAAIDIPHYCQEGGHAARRLASPDDSGQLCVFEVICGGGRASRA